MRFAHLVVCSVATAVAWPLPASAQSVDSLKAAREQRRDELRKAQEAFDRADEAYIKALAGAAVPSGTATLPAAPAARKPEEAVRAPLPAPVETAPREVTFTMNGTGALEASPFDYRARLVVDGRPEEWTEHASGAKQTAPATAQSLGYEIQHLASSDAAGSSWSTACQGTLALKRKTTVEVVVERGIHCVTR